MQEALICDSLSADMTDGYSTDPLCAQLNYEFKDRTLLELALTHPSSYIRGEVNTHYERLEFLGDAVLELVVTEYLYNALPLVTEGLMTQLRARVVGRPNLSCLAKELNLNVYMKLGKGEERSGGRMRESNLANTFEAVIGAIFQDSCFEKTKSILLPILKESLENVTTDPREDNPKGELQMIVQKIFSESPQYITEENEPGKDGRFTSTVLWKGVILGSGVGESKRKAEVEAAREALLLQLWGASDFAKND